MPEEDEGLQDTTGISVPKEAEGLYGRISGGYRKRPELASHIPQRCFSCSS